MIGEETLLNRLQIIINCNEGEEDQDYLRGLKKGQQMAARLIKEQLENGALEADKWADCPECGSISLLDERESDKEEVRKCAECGYQFEVEIYREAKEK